MKNRRIVYKLLVCGVVGGIVAALPLSRNLDVFILAGAMVLGFWLGREELE